MFRYHIGMWRRHAISLALCLTWASYSKAQQTPTTAPPDVPPPAMRLRLLGTDGSYHNVTTDGAGNMRVGAGSGDPCSTETHAYASISQTSATTAAVVAGTSGKKTYICSIFLFTGVANNVGIVEGTGTNCSTVSGGVVGGTTAANGLNLAANQGWQGGIGSNAIAATATGGDNVCLVTSSAGPLAGHIVTVQQ
ncbi:MAG TPA: hypothetical protein VGC34_09965 [Steroidobacteraceae bacterium]